MTDILFIRGNSNAIGYAKTLGLPVKQFQGEDLALAPAVWFGKIDKKKVSKYLLRFFWILDKKAKLSWGRWSIENTSLTAPEQFQNLINYYSA